MICTDIQRGPYISSLPPSPSSFLVWHLSLGIKACRLKSSQSALRRKVTRRPKSSPLRETEHFDAGTTEPTATRLQSVFHLSTQPATKWPLQTVQSRRVEDVETGCFCRLTCSSFRSSQTPWNPPSLAISSLFLCLQFGRPRQQDTFASSAL